MSGVRVSHRPPFHPIEIIETRLPATALIRSDVTKPDVVPEHLRPYLDGKRELEIQLGGDKRVALRNHAAAVSSIQQEIENPAGDRKGAPENTHSRQVRRQSPCPTH